MFCVNTVSINLGNNGPQPLTMRMNLRTELLAQRTRAESLEKLNPVSARNEGGAFCAGSPNYYPGEGVGVFVTFYYEPQSIVWKKMSCVERTSVSRARNVLRSPDKIILQGGKGITQGGQHSWGTHIAMQVLDSLPTIPLENKSPRWPLRDHTTALTRQSEKKGFVCVRKIGTCGLEWNFQHRTQVQGVL